MSHLKSCFIHLNWVQSVSLKWVPWDLKIIFCVNRTASHHTSTIISHCKTGLHIWRLSRNTTIPWKKKCVCALEQSASVVSRIIHYEWDMRPMILLPSFRLVLVFHMFLSNIARSEIVGGPGIWFIIVHDFWIFPPFPRAKSAMEKRNQRVDRSLKNFWTNLCYKERDTLPETNSNSYIPGSGLFLVNHFPKFQHETKECW